MLEKFYNAKIANDQIVLESKSGLPLSISFSEASSQIVFLLGDVTLPYVHLGMDGPEDQDSIMTDGIGMDEFKQHLPEFVEIEAIGGALPLADVLDSRYSMRDLMVMEKDTIEKTFNNGLPSESDEEPPVFTKRLLLHPRIIKAIEDKGAYRIIHLKHTFNLGVPFITKQTLPRLAGVAGLPIATPV